jgi:formamidopyrimidine-DNA glycosylase
VVGRGYPWTMPELVDVEGFRRIAQEAAGREVGRVRVFDAQILRDTTERTLRSRLRHQRFDQPCRHGKWLVLPVSGTTVAVLMHFGMTGSLHWDTDGRDPHRHDRVEFELTGGVLRYRDMRKLTGVRLAGDRRAQDAVLGELGPDAAAITHGELGAEPAWRT